MILLPPSSCLSIQVTAVSRTTKMKALRWLVINGGVALLVYFAAVLGSERAATWIFWLSVMMALITSMMINSKVIATIAAKPDWPNSPIWLDFSYDLVIITMLVTGGLMNTAAIYSIHTMFVCMSALKVSELRKTLPQPTSN